MSDIVEYLNKPKMDLSRPAIKLTLTEAQVILLREFLGSVSEFDAQVCVYGAYDPKGKPVNYDLHSPESDLYGALGTASEVLRLPAPKRSLEVSLVEVDPGY